MQLLESKMSFSPPPGLGMEAIAVIGRSQKGQLPGRQAAGVVGTRRRQMAREDVAGREGKGQAVCPPLPNHCFPSTAMDNFPFINYNY